MHALTPASMVTGAPWWCGGNREPRRVTSARFAALPVGAVGLVLSVVKLY